MARQSIKAALAILGLAAGLAGCGVSGMALRTRIYTTPHCSDFFFPVYFANRSAELTPQAAKVVADAGGHARGCKVASVEVTGLADYRGPAEPNLELSRMRAERVARALAKAGLPEPSFKLSAVGEAGAVADDGLPKPLRRRADVVIRFMQ
jgi:peptidoglycan-associated lipoprotein